MDAVKPKRRYDSSGRREQARRTCLAILAAARDLFIERGYGQTTMVAIAQRAGVSVETVYAAFSSKPNLLKEVWDVTIGGDDEDIPLHERPHFRAMRAEPDLATRLAMYAAIVTEMSPRTIPFIMALRGAAATEPAAATMLEEIDRQRLNGMTIAAGELAAGLAVSEEEARDVLWTTNAGDLWHHLVQKRGWPPERFERWLTRLWQRMLLRS